MLLITQTSFRLMLLWSFLLIVTLVYRYKSPQTAYTKKALFGKNTTNVSLDESTRLEHILGYTRPYVTRVSDVRLRFTNTTRQWWSCQNISPRVLRGHAKDYFEKAEHLGIETIKLRLNLSDLGPFLATRYYDYASNDCGTYHSRAIKVNLLKNAAICKPTIAETRRSSELKVKDVQVGVPSDGKSPNRTDVIWSFLHVIQNGVARKNGDVISEHVKLEPLRCKLSWQPKCSETERNMSMRVFDEVLTIKQFWGWTFYHATIEELPRLMLYREFLLNHPDIRVHASSAHPFLELLGIPAHRVVFGDIAARTLYVPAGVPCGHTLLLQTQLLSLALRTGVPHHPPDTVVLIKRSAKRYFRNHDAILEMLTQHSTKLNLTVEVFSDNPLPSIQETRRMFQRAAVVVAPHGAGEANIVLSGPGTVLIEGVCYDASGRTNVCFANLARALGMRYYAAVFPHSCNDVSPRELEKPFVEYLELLYGYKGS